MSFKLYILSAAQGFHLAENALGLIYLMGNEVVPQDYKLAIRYYTRAAENGNIDAQYNLGIIYNSDEYGTKTDQKLAARYIKMAAENGHIEAQGQLPLRYFLGTGVIENRVNAYMWANLASEAGNEQAQAIQLYLEKFLTPAQIGEAVILARECKKKSYKGC